MIKRIIGLVILAIGIYLVVFASHAMHQIKHAKNTLANVEQNIQSSPVAKFFGNEAKEKISSYDTPVLATLISGIILCVGGISIVVFAKKKKK